MTPRRSSPRVHLTVDAVREISLLIARLERAAQNEWRAHPVLSSDVELAARYLRRVLETWSHRTAETETEFATSSGKTERRA